MQNKFGLPSDVIEEILRILSSYPEVEKAKVFGSRAKGNYKRYSDIDIAIFVSENRSIIQNIKEDLGDLDTIYDFDILDYNRLSNEELKAHIDRVGISIHG